MAGGEQQRDQATARPIVYCLIPRELAPKVHDRLRSYFAEDPAAAVVVERRHDERRCTGERRVDHAEQPRTERRRIRSPRGRRAAERRAALVPVEAPRLPAKLRPYASRLVFVERLEPAGQKLEDADTARLLTSVQAGDSDAFAIIYMRYFDRVYGYLRLLLRTPEEAEDAAQGVFMRALEALPSYEIGEPPFRAWLFAVARNSAIDYLRKHGRVDPAGIGELPVLRERPGLDERGSEVAGWISDRDLLLFVERLPLAQRQVLVLRFGLGFAQSEIAGILGCTPAAVTMLQQRALSFLRQRLGAINHESVRGQSARSRTWRRPAIVVRARRFALIAPGPNR